MSATEIVWFEPRWSSTPRIWQDLLAVFPLRSVARIVTASGLLATAIAVLGVCVVPDLRFDWLMGLYWLIGLVASILAVTLLLVTAHVLPPQMFVITRNGLSWYNCGVFVNMSEITSACLTLRVDGKHYLRFHLTEMRHRIPTRIGVPPNINQNDLLDILEDKLVIRNYRSRRLRT